MNNSKDETVKELQENIILIIRKINDIKNLKFYKQFITKMEEVD